jgi:G3E family GTPase
MLKATLATMTASAAGIGLHHFVRRRRLRKRIMALIRKSQQLHRDKENVGSLESARQAYALAVCELPGSPTLLTASLHLAGLYHATNQFDESLSLLAKIEASITNEKHLVPVLHARAEVFEAAERPLALAAAELERAREIRRRVKGPMSMDAAFAGLNLASVLVRQAQESVPVSDPRLRARIALMHSEEQILALVQQAETLALEAHSIALAAGDPAQAAEFVGEVLDLLKADGGSGAAAMIAKGAEASITRLGAAYLEAAGEEWTQDYDKDDDDLPSAATKGSDEVPPLPVTVLSGFLGSGKTTLLTHLLNNQDGYRIAIIVNDMASVNVDAELVRRGTTVLEKMVELSNGCICCTLREDLLSSLAALAAEKRFDHVLVESSGISEPLPVAETFTFGDEDSGLKLGDVAKLHNLVTVVDAAAILDQLATMDTLIDRGWQAQADDDRTVSHLLCDQLEFADVLLLNKTDLLNESNCDTVASFLKKINPTAEVMRTVHSRINPDLLLGKARFSLQKAEEHTKWLVEARHNEHTPETAEYGISSFVFRARRPFHPGRLQTALGGRPRVGALKQVLRLKGIAWLATQQETQGHAALAGTQFTLVPGPPWWAATARGEWPEGLKEEIQELWHEEHGDRQTELVCIGSELDHAAVEAELEACLLTDDEMAGGEHGWHELPDPFREAWERAMEEACGHDHDHSHGGDGLAPPMPARMRAALKRKEMEKDGSRV